MEYEKLTDREVTISLEEYRALIRTNSNYEILLGLLVGAMYLDYGGSLVIHGTRGAEIVEQFAPIAYRNRESELRKEKENNDV